MRSVVYQRMKVSIEAVLGVPDIVGWSRHSRRRSMQAEIELIYRVEIRRGKEVFLDFNRLTFQAPRWGYENWTPIFQHSKFFLDVYASGHELETRYRGEGERRRRLDDYLLFRRQKDSGLLELEDRK